MNAATRNSSSLTETLQARKAYLTGLLKIVDTRIGNSTATQNLTIAAIKAEMGLIEHKLKKNNEISGSSQKLPLHSNSAGSFRPKSSRWT